jgi:hypothetical protein
LAAPRNDSAPVSDVPVTATGAGSVVVVIGLDVDPAVVFDDDPGRVELPGCTLFAEQALTATTTPSSTPNTARDETRLVT